MVLVRRRSDGLFFTNKAHRYGHKVGWTVDVNECKPFVNERGARWSFYHYQDIKMCDCKNGGRPSWQGSCTKSCARVQAVRRAFDVKYEIVPVTVTKG